MKTTFKSADIKMSILSNVRRCWQAMPPVAGFLVMFAGVPYNREKTYIPLCFKIFQIMVYFKAVSNYFYFNYKKNKVAPELCHSH